MPFFHVMGLIDKNRGVWGTNMGHMWDVMDRLQGDLDEILDRVEAGDFAPVVDKTFSFAEAADAHRYMHERKNFGKVILTP